MGAVKKYLHDLDLVRNKLLNPILNPLSTSQRITLGASLSALDEGYTTYDITLDAIYFWDGSAWITPSGGSTSSLQQVVNVGNGISNFGGLGTASIQSTNFTNNRTLYLNDDAYPAIRLVDNNNASNFLQIDVDTLNIDGVSYNWSSIVNPPSGPLVALPFTTDHLSSTNNEYVVGDIVWYAGNVYRCIANNDSLQPNLAPLYWTLLGAGFPLVQQPADWNSTSGNNQILNKPTIPASIVTGTGTATQVAFWDTGSSISSDVDLYWDNINKRLGIGTTAPKVRLHIGNAGGLMGFPFEEAIVEKTGDTKFGVYTSTGGFSPAIGVGITLGYTGVTANSTYYPGFEFQHKGDAVDADNYVRYNFIQRDLSGNVVGGSQNLLNIYASGRITLNPVVAGTFTPPVPQFLVGLNTSIHVVDIESVLSTRISSLGGGGTQMVVADNDGVLGAQTIPTGSSVGFEMNFLLMGA
jgi:hypothetical protein